MKSNIKILLLVLALVVVIVGASILYKNLSPEAGQDQLVTQPAASQPTTPQPTQDPGATTSQSATSQDTTPHIDLAPDFEVYDLQGNPVRLSDFRGKPVVLNFWATWCGYCVREMPDFEEMYCQLEGEVHFLMVNVTDGHQETVASASAFVKEKGFTFTVLYDTRLEAANTYGAYSLPMTFFIDAQGGLVAYGTGMLDMATLQRGIDMIYQPAK